MTIQFINDYIVRVSQFGDNNTPHASLVVTDQPEYDAKASAGKLSAVSENGRLTFRDPDGNILLTEVAESRTIKSCKADETAFETTLQFELHESDGIYGLGQHQQGMMNYRGKKVELVQTNVEVVVPTLLSTGGWGILLDNYSHTIIDDTGDTLSIWSEAGNGIDYYFVYGPSADEIICRFRDLTGHAPLFGKWAYGFWQCKERYKNREELVGTIREYRERKIPIDNIVQDWRYWGKHGWSGMKFDETTFPEPEEMIRQIHDEYHAKLMVSIWPVVGNNSDVSRELDESGHLLPKPHWANARCYDAFSSKARDIYWKHAKEGLFDKGVDAWWMDGTEPEVVTAHDYVTSKDGISTNGQTELGSWNRYLNAFSLMTTKGIYENQRAETDQKRVFILSRSGFIGQQRYAAASWSGDIAATWEVFRKQISAGLNFCMAGTPYWTTDIGGFFTNGNGASYPKGCNDDSYKELYVRWYQYGAFCPLFRSHGTGTPREIWQFGDVGHWAYEAQLKYDNLRYRLMPMIYSLAGMVTHQGYTMMRGLPMDFPKDAETHSIDDQFMFGPAIMVSPITHCIFHPRKEADSPISDRQWGCNKEKLYPVLAQFYKGLEFNELVREKDVLRVHFDWSGSPPQDMPEENYSIRFTGNLVSRESGEHEIIFSVDHGLRVWFNNDLVIDEWECREPRKVSVKKLLEAGQYYDVKIEYCHEQGNTARIAVSWATPHDSERLKLEQEAPDYRNVYLPKSSGWFDFWTGETLEGGKSLRTPAPIDHLPLHVKAGSIIPMGPYMQYTTEKPADPIELRIYPGADASFELYEDENDNYNYEQGAYSTIPFRWNDRDKSLTIGERHGEFDGMLQQRTFNVVIVRDGHGVGVAPCENPDMIVSYSGEALSVHC